MSCEFCCLRLLKLENIAKKRLLEVPFGDLSTLDQVYEFCIQNLGIKDLKKKVHKG